MKIEKLYDGRIKVTNHKNQINKVTYLQDLSGVRFNMLIALFPFKEKSGWKWMFQCDCGIKKAINANPVKSGKVKSCGCYNLKKKPACFIDLSGRRFGKLSIINHVGGVRWNCKCDCGYEFVVNSISLKRQNQKRCRFCYYKSKRKHGGSGTPEYQAWKHIMERCYNKKDRMYINYGARGITVCKRWHNVKNFLKDMGRKPSKKYSIDRIDVNKGYSPSNCRWATKYEQMRNRTNNVFITYNGETKIISDWSKEICLSVAAISRRLKLGWGVEKALTTPSRNKNKYV